MRVFSVPAGVIEVTDLAGTVVQIIVIHGTFMEPREVLGRKTQVQDRKTGIQSQDKRHGVLVLPCRLGFLDHGLALELRKTEVCDGIAERCLVIALVQGDGVAVRVVGGGVDFPGDPVDIAVDGCREQGGGFGRVGQEAFGDEGVVGFLGEGHLGVQLLFERLDQHSICLFRVHPVVVRLFKDTKKSYICTINPCMI